MGLTGGIEVVWLELELEDQIPARVSDDVVAEEEEAGCAAEEQACVVEDEIFISEDEDGFVMEEVAKKRSPVEHLVPEGLWF